jgi:hypothetical protein
VWSQTGGCKQREYKESLEKYNARFKLTLTQGAWVRTILGKSTEGAWIIKMRELFIENLNCPLIEVLVIDMPETYSLQGIFAKLQKLGRNLDLDADVKPPGGIVSCQASKRGLRRQNRIKLIVIGEQRNKLIVIRNTTSHKLRVTRETQLQHVARPKNYNSVERWTQNQHKQPCLTGNFQL